MTKLKLIGTPVASFTFIDLPSVNRHYNLHYRPRSIATAEWRYEGKHKAGDFIGWEDVPYIKTRALCIAWVFPPYEEVSDIHNVHIKPLLDGFTDAGLWPDDEWAWLPATMFLFGGIGHHKPRDKKVRKTVLDVYELGSITINGDKLKLPKGRRKL